MTSTRITPSRLGFAAGVALLTTFAVSAPASAVEFQPKVAVTATSGCEGNTFHLHTTMSNTGNVSAQFLVTAAATTPQVNGIAVDIAAGGSRDDDWKFTEGVLGFVHIVSFDNPGVDYYFQITPDCVPEVITTIPSTIPDTTIPATTIPDSTIPATTVPATTIPAPTTTAAAVLAPTALPATGSSSPTLGVLAFGLLGIGILMLRFTRRVS